MGAQQILWRYAESDFTVYINDCVDFYLKRLIRESAIHGSCSQANS